MATVIIPTWDSAASLRSTLTALALSSLNRLAPHRLEVVVADDGSTDGTGARIRTWDLDLDLRLVELPHRGQSHAINAAAEQARGDILVVCDSDMVLGCGALDELVSRHERFEHAICFGFRSNISENVGDHDPTLNRKHVWQLIHREAFSGDIRVAFDKPTLIPNMLQATGWLSTIDGRQTLIDSEGSMWRRHRFLFGALFSLPFGMFFQANGMPTCVPRWGYQDTLLAARLEELGGFLLPVLSAWGHHVTHPIRHQDQWFQYARNRLAYDFIMSQDSPDRPWSASPLDPDSIHSRLIPPATVSSKHSPLGIAARNKLPSVIADLDTRLVALMSYDDRARYLYCRNDVEELLEGEPTTWQALVLARRNQRQEAVRRLNLIRESSASAQYVLSGSLPEFRYIARHFTSNGLPFLARPYEDAAMVHMAAAAG